MDWSQHTALITGAGSGIGRALAEALHRRGTNLLLTDIDPERLAGTASGLTGGAHVISRTLDVCDSAAIKSLAADRGLPAPTILINNAGVAVGGHFEDVSEADFDWLLAVNLLAPIRMTRAFLPKLREADAAVIINISSLFGLVAPSGQTAYCASKYGLRGFSDSLRHELQDTPVRVVTVHPGGVRTAIADDARLPAGRNAGQQDRDRMNAFLTMPSARAAEIILRGVERGKRRVLVGRDAKIAALIERLFPDSYWRHLTRFAKFDKEEPASP